MKFVEIGPDRYLNLDSIEQVTFKAAETPKGSQSSGAEKVCSADVVFRAGDRRPLHFEEAAATKLRSAVLAEVH